METKQSKTEQAREYARTSRASGAIPEGWTHTGGLHYVYRVEGATVAHYCGSYSNRLTREGMRDCYAYDVHDAAALVRYGLRKGFSL